MPHSYFPLRWESTGEQWWYASPIDCAAANGHYDLVRELLHIDTNLLIKLTSLRRIRRLETVWDDQSQFNNVAKSRAYVARKLLLDCEAPKNENQNKKEKNTLIRAGYGGWFLYTAASAGDLEFVKDLLERDPFLVFGEGEYGITDILYAAARSKCCEVFRFLIDFALSLRKKSGGGGEEEGCGNEEFKWELMNRGVHAAARGGNLDVLKELLVDCDDVSGYRDALGSSILHVAAARGQVEVVKYLIAAYDDIIHAVDNKGNTSLHVAAYRGYRPVVQALLTASPILAPVANNEGDTFLHMAISGFRTPSFHRIDQQIDLLKQLTSGTIINNMKGIINIRNRDGRTALHVSVVENIHSEVVELLMNVPSIDLNVTDGNGMTPLDLLNEWPKTAPSKILIKRLVAAGGRVSGDCGARRNGKEVHIKLPGIGGTSPGTSFRVLDAELFSYVDHDDKNSENVSEASCEPAASPDFGYYPSDQLSHLDSAGSGINNRSDTKKSTSPANPLKVLLQWTKKKDSGRTLGTKLKSREDDDAGDDYASGLYKITKNLNETPISLRQRYSTTSASSLPNNKRLLPTKSDLPSPSTKKKFTESLSHGVIQAMRPRSPFLSRSPSSPFSRSSFSSPSSMIVELANEYPSGGGRSRMKQRQSSFRKVLMNQYFCFGAEGLAGDDSINCKRPSGITRSSTTRI